MLFWDCTSVIVLHLIKLFSRLMRGKHSLTKEDEKGVQTPSQRTHVIWFEEPSQNVHQSLLTQQVWQSFHQTRTYCNIHLHTTFLTLIKTRRLSYFILSHDKNSILEMVFPSCCSHTKALRYYQITILTFPPHRLELAKNIHRSIKTLHMYTDNVYKECKNRLEMQKWVSWD